MSLPEGWTRLYKTMDVPSGTVASYITKGWVMTSPDAAQALESTITVLQAQLAALTPPTT